MRKIFISNWLHIEKFLVISSSRLSFSLVFLLISKDVGECFQALIGILNAEEKALSNELHYSIKSLFFRPNRGETTPLPVFPFNGLVSRFDILTLFDYFSLVWWLVISAVTQDHLVYKLSLSYPSLLKHLSPLPSTHKVCWPRQPEIQRSLSCKNWINCLIAWVDSPLERFSLMLSVWIARTIHRCPFPTTVPDYLSLGRISSYPLG